MDTVDVIDNILEGNVFIYPTDTIYGIGCDATNKEAVDRLKKIKGRDKDKPLSVIAPHFDWIRENFYLDSLTLKKLRRYFPGAYTLLLKKKRLNFLPWISPNNRIGVRIPRSRVCFQIQASGVPVVITSVNLSGKKPACKVSDILKEIINNVDFVIKADNEKMLKGKASTLILDGKRMKR